MALPKKKISRSRRDKRRYAARHRLDSIQLTQCPDCGETIRPHRVCHQCFSYRGRNVIEQAPAMTGEAAESGEA